MATIQHSFANVAEFFNSPLGVDGIRAALPQARARGAALRIYVLAMAGDDLRQLPLHLRKTNLERLLARRPDGITVAPFERGEVGSDLYRAACRMGLEGLVSKHRARPPMQGQDRDDCRY
jgi:bifunctional non-homologous end joining protein LigD